MNIKRKLQIFCAQQIVYYWAKLMKLHECEFCHHHHKHWTLWSAPSPELQLLAPTLLRSSNCSSSLWSVVVWFQMIRFCGILCKCEFCNDHNFRYRRPLRLLASGTKIPNCATDLLYCIAQNGSNWQLILSYRYSVYVSWNAKCSNSVCVRLVAYSEMLVTDDLRNRIRWMTPADR